MINPKEKLEDFVKDINVTFSDRMFRPIPIDGEFKLNVLDDNESVKFVFSFEDKQNKLILVSYDFTKLASYTLEEMYQGFYYRVFRYTLFWLDMWEENKEGEPERPFLIRILSIQTLFNEGLSRMKK